MGAMSPSARTRRTTYRPAGPSAGATFWVAVAIVSAAAGYLLHHSGYFSSHRLETALFAVFLASACGVILGSLIANRRHPAPLPVVLATGTAVVVSPSSGRDAGSLAAIHARYLGKGLFVSLGPAFLRSYYDGYLCSPYGIALVAKAKEQPVGMLVGTIDQRRHLRWIFRDQFLKLTALALVALATRPMTTVRFLRTRVGRYRAALRRARTTPDSDGDSMPAVLSHVAVLDGARGEGVGTQLVVAFESAAKDAGKSTAVLTTDAGASGATEFYLRHGWEVVGTAVGLDGELSTSMRKDLV